MTTLHTARLTLRRPAPSDWPAFRDFMLSDRAGAFGSQENLGKSFRSFAAELGHWDIFGYGMWAVTMTGDDACVALVGPWNPPDWPEREIGWMILAAEAEGRGIAFEAGRAALAGVFDQFGFLLLPGGAGRAGEASGGCKSRRDAHYGSFGQGA